MAQVFVAMPFFHSFGYKAGWLACLMRGATILPQPVFDHVQPPKVVHRQTAGVWGAEVHLSGVNGR
mgnify:CR=1 FL=1